MRNRKWKERAAAVVLAGVVATGSVSSDSVIVNAEETSAETEAIVADENGFCIENGVLKAYSGKSQNIVIPENVTEIASTAFQKNTTITAIQIGAQVKKIAPSAFSNMTGLKTVVIENGLTEIPDYCFLGCEKLEEVQFPEGLTSIGEGAFCECKALSTVIFPDSLEVLGVAAFAGCDQITSVTLPEELQSYGDGAFSSLKELVVPGGIKTITTDLLGKSKNTIERLVLSEGVEVVEGWALYGATNLQTVTFPNSLKEIQDASFEGCNSLTELYIPSADQILSAFSGCENLKKVTLGPDVKRLEESFYACKALNEVSFEPGIQVIGANSFAGTALTKIELPSTVVYLGDDAFRMTTLSNVQLPNSSLQYVSNTAFRDTKWLSNWKNEALQEGKQFLSKGNVLFGVTTPYEGEEETLKLPGGITVISDFETKQKTIKVPEGITGISNLGAEVAEQIHLPDSVTSLGSFVLGSSETLTDVKLPQNLTTIEYCLFADNTALQMIEIPKKVTSIQFGAFDDCTGLTQVSLPNGLQSIDSYAFSGCTALKEITIPETVNYIGDSAFEEIENSIMIKGYTGSVAETFAKGHGISFVSIGTVGDNAGITPSDTEQPTATRNPAYETEDTEQDTQEDQTVYTVTLQSQGGLVEYNQLTVQNNSYYGVLPAASRDGYLFLGWFTDVEGGRMVTSTTRVNLASDQILYAHWSRKKVLVEFDANGGEVPQTQNLVFMGDTYGTLPEPTNASATFLGWYTQKEGGSQITSDMQVEGSGTIQLYAHWASKFGKLSLEELSYAFGNTADDYGYTDGYKIFYSMYSYLYQDNKFAYQRWKNANLWAGNCFGMVASSVFFHEMEDDVELEDFNKEAKNPAGLFLSDQNEKLGLDLTHFIEVLHVAQYSPSIIDEEQKTKDRIGEICRKTEIAEAQKGYPIIICMFGKEGGHAVIGYHYDKQNGKLYVYDPNDPNKERYIEIGEQETTWSYCVDNKYMWGSGTGEDAQISYITYENLLSVWNKRTEPVYTSQNMVKINSSNAAVYNSEKKKIAIIKDGVLTSKIDQVYQIRDTAGTEKEEGCNFFISQGTFYVKNTGETEEFQVSAAGSNRTNEVTTQADVVKITIDDSEQINEVSLAPKTDETYSITMESSDAKEKSNISVKGMGKNAKMIVASQSKQGVSFENVEQENVEIEGNSVALANVDASVSDESKGNISRAGNKKILQGEDAEYAITPNAGYMILDVMVDGKSYGNISTFIFRNVAKDHNIVASFADASFEKAATRVLDETVVSGQIPKLRVKIGRQTLTEQDDYEVSLEKETDKSMTLQIQGKNYYSRTSMLVSLDKETKLVTQLSWSLDGNTTVTKEDPNKQTLKEESNIAEEVDQKESKATATPQVTEPPKEETAQEQTPIVSEQPSRNLKVGERCTKGNFIYVVINTKKKTVALTGVVKEKKKMVIPANVKLSGVTYQVIKIAPEIFQGDKKIKQIVIGANVTTIGAKAFADARNLKKIICKSSKLKVIGKNAWKGIASKALMKVPKGKKESYWKLCKGTGQSATFQIK